MEEERFVVTRKPGHPGRESHDRHDLCVDNPTCKEFVTVPWFDVAWSVLQEPVLEAPDRVPAPEAFENNLSESNDRSKASISFYRIPRSNS